MKILIDNGHGSNTVGKRSPDGRLLEWKYTREITAAIVAALKKRGVDAQLLTPETTDVRLSVRTARANAETKKAKGTAHCILVSVHCNAAGSDDRWHQARGWSVFVGLKASSQSMALAALLAEEAKKVGLTVRKPTPGQPYWKQNLAICRDTVCPAVLTENLFQDNRADVDYLLSDAGRKAIVRLHVQAILRYIDAYGG